ncbi:MAG: N-acetyl-alpha-D-glucosaminyl L-malate synthase BshA [Candidatus Hinthialibacter antarcticus]|nr:N-acetyl-alpha-D-glucosaminyl L-malate synthase BshA [Candidatus Hinthialibacter antarcticus]
MRIGIVCYPSIGGSGIVATDLGKSLARMGHEIHFFSYDVPHKLEGATEKFHFHHVDIPFYPLFRFPPYTLALATSIYEANAVAPLDILHVHYAVPHSTSALLAKQMICSKRNEKLKVITTLHGTDTDLVGQMPQYKPAVEYSLNWSDAVTAVSRYLKDMTERQFEIHKPIHVIYNPIDSALFSPSPEEDRAQRSEKRIIHISNFRPVKRVIDVIKTFDLISNVIQARLVLVGDGPDRSEAEMLVAQLGLVDKVEFAGPQQDVVESLRNADLLLSTSETESFGLTIAEAMSCEVPVVATSVGGVPEVIKHGVTGFLAPLGDIQCLAESAIEILRCPKRFAAIGKAGRQRILEHFEMEKITKQYVDLYNEVLNSDDPNCPTLSPAKTEADDQPI